MKYLACILTLGSKVIKPHFWATDPAIGVQDFSLSPHLSENKTVLVRRTLTSVAGTLF